MLPVQRSNSRSGGFLSVLLILFCGVFEIIVGRVPQTNTNITAQDQKVSEARQAITSADRLCSDWTQSSFRQAISQYDEAALIWSSLADFSHASDAVLKSADAYFRLSEYPEALKRYQNAVALAEQGR